MNLSLGYLKDLIAFISSILFFILYFLNKIEIKKEYVIFFYTLVLIFDGIFSIFLSLHNFVIYQSAWYIYSIKKYKMETKKIIEDIVAELLDDDEFVYDCRIQIEEIVKDNKIDYDDIPEILSLVIILSQKYYLFFDITEQDIYEIFSILIIELLKKFKILNRDDPKVNKIIQSSLKLLVLHVKINKNRCSCLKF